MCDFEGPQAAYKALQDMNRLFGGRTDGWTAVYAECLTVIKQAREAEAQQAQQANTPTQQNFFILWGQISNDFSGNIGSLIINGQS
jgi:hypothetical protein